MSNTELASGVRIRMNIAIAVCVLGLTLGAASWAADEYCGQCPGYVPTAHAFGSGSQMIYFDDRGLVVQQDGDPGDTAQRIGWYWVGAWYLRNDLHVDVPVEAPISLAAAASMLEEGESGVFRRHPCKWNCSRDFSRDQTVALLGALGLWGIREPIARMKGQFDKRATVLGIFRRPGYYFQNADVEIPPLSTFDNLMRRVAGDLPTPDGDSLPVGLWGSVWARIGVIKAQNTAFKQMDDVGDDLNLIVTLLVAHAIKPSKDSERAMQDWAKNRPDSFGCYLDQYRAKLGDGGTGGEAVGNRILKGIAEEGWKPEAPSVLCALRWYFRNESGASPGLAEMYRPIVDKYLR